MVCLGCGGDGDTDMVEIERDASWLGFKGCGGDGDAEVVVVVVILVLRVVED